MYTCMTELYSQPLSDLITAQECDYHKYAVDTHELFKSTPPDFSYVQLGIQSCIWRPSVLDEISNKLKLNADNTEVMPTGTSSRLGLVDSEFAHIGGTVISFKPSIKYLGVKTDQTVLMQEHISNICHTPFLELYRCIVPIRLYLSKSVCNSILTGLLAEQISQLQRVQNNAARLVSHEEEVRTLNTLGERTPLATS